MRNMSVAVDAGSIYPGLQKTYDLAVQFDLSSGLTRSSAPACATHFRRVSQWSSGYPGQTKVIRDHTGRAH
jgi:hypothetical protein